MPQPQFLSIGQMATLACQLEVCAPKPGNVHRGADFEDVTLQEFLASAVAIGSAFDRAAELPLGDLIFAAVQATASVSRTNTNLGTILLLAPLAKANEPGDLQVSAISMIEQSTDEDAARIYEAIRLANPGGMGEKTEHDLASAPPPHISTAMQAAAEWDLVARQYAHGFEELFSLVLPWITEVREGATTLAARIIDAHVRLMAQVPDSLIQRKLGREMAEQSSILAQRVLDAGPPDSEAYFLQLANLDFWLRCDGHRRNPGTSADMIAAGLFAGIRSGKITPPFL